MTAPRTAPQTAPQTAPEALAALPPVSLQELNEQAALQTRVDRKYLVPAGAVPALIAALTGRAAVLDIDGRRDFAYASLYFDTGDLVSYHLSARRRRRRFKVRTRTYVDSASCWLEVKTCGGRNSTVKDRLPYLLEHRASVLPGIGFVQAALERASIPFEDGALLRPTLASSYRRSTFLLAGSGSRATIDTGLVWEDAATGRRLTPARLAVVETKTGSTPSAVDRLLWSLGHRPARISKYATGLAALRPGLPDAPWRRTLRTCFSSPAPTTETLGDRPCHARHCSCATAGSGEAPQPPPPARRPAPPPPPLAAARGWSAG